MCHYLFELCSVNVCMYVCSCVRMFALCVYVCIRTCVPVCLHACVFEQHLFMSIRQD